MIIQEILFNEFNLFWKILEVFGFIFPFSLSGLETFPNN